MIKSTTYQGSAPLTRKQARKQLKLRRNLLAGALTCFALTVGGGIVWIFV